MGCILIEYSEVLYGGKECRKELKGEPCRQAGGWDSGMTAWQSKENFISQMLHFPQKQPRLDFDTDEFSFLFILFKVLFVYGSERQIPSTHIRASHHMVQD